MSLPGGPPLKDSLNPANHCCPKNEFFSDKIIAGHSPSQPFIPCCPNTNLLFKISLKGLTNIVSVSAYMPPYSKSTCKRITSLLCAGCIIGVPKTSVGGSTK